RRSSALHRPDPAGLPGGGEHPVGVARPGAAARHRPDHAAVGGVAVSSSFSVRESIMFTHKPVSVASGTLLLTLLSACMSVGPDYQSPFLVAADNWSEAHGGSAALLDGELREQNTSINMLEGFSLFGDETLQSLQTRALENNADLRSALLRFAQSRV